MTPPSKGVRKPKSKVSYLEGCPDCEREQRNRRKKKPIEFKDWERQRIFLCVANTHGFKKLANKCEKWFLESTHAKA